MEQEKPQVAPWRDRLHEIIFEADTRAGKAFDVG
ncbi:MAG TPA: ion transporter, partial [Phycisphaerales bacterium]|nr:ion transporter [Phycisphaerales bacterium]